MTPTLLSPEQLDVLARAPIPGPHAAGCNVRLEPLFESLAREMARLDSLTADDPVRWPEVQTLCQQILTQQSKDFLVVCYLGRALCERDVVTGLQQGLELSLVMAQRHWDAAFPPVKRARGRAQAFEWLVEKCQPLLERADVPTARLDDVRRLEAAVVALDDFLLDRMGAQAPNLADLRQRCKRLRQGLELTAVEQPASKRSQPERPPARTVETITTASTGNSARMDAVATLPAGNVTQEKDVIAIFRACQEPLRAASQYLRQKNPADPDSYRINRFVTWLGITQLPPATNGKTQLKSVPREKLATLAGLQREQRWAELLGELETSIARAPYWLDGHRLVSEALEAIGAVEACATVIEAVRGFVTRLPGLIELSFADDTPFADDTTRHWLQQTQRTGMPTGSSTELAIDSENLSPRWQDCWEQAQTLAREKQIRAALALFQAGCLQSTSLREQTLWRYQQARFCFEQGLPQLATTLLENLDAYLQERGVADWEPQLTTRILDLLLRCYRVTGATETEPNRTDRLHARLCQQDLALAYDLTNLNQART